MKNNIIITILFVSLFSFSLSKAESPVPVDVSRVSCSMFTENLKYGDGVKNVDLKLVKFGPDSKLAKVLELQNLLIEKGYLLNEATGYFGAKTFTAVKKYQKENGIKATGFVGEITRGVMRSVYCQDQINTDKNIISGNCKIWSDGCNTCSRSTINGVGMCTLMACIDRGMAQPGCREYFTTKTCTEGGKVYKEGESVSCLTQKDQVSKACIADAAYFCREGIWKIEGGYPVSPVLPL